MNYVVFFYFSSDINDCENKTINKCSENSKCQDDGIEKIKCDCNAGFTGVYCDIGG